jgi:hypothetical protein
MNNHDDDNVKNRKKQDAFDRAFVGNPVVMLILIGLVVIGSYIYNRLSH